ncbi:MAG: 3-deoxy-manno-octulosonate cytidylyltransferase [Acidobacteriota bacterium]
MIACAVVIPARWASSRFPGKVVATLAGKPLVLHACELASRAANVEQIIVATDDERVVRLVQRAGYQAVMTRHDHPSGTDRVAEVMAESSASAVIGLQADEPFLEPSDLDLLAHTVVHDEECRLATLCSPLDGLRDFLDPNVVKVVLDSAGRALYFSRSPIPYQRPIGAGQLPSTPEMLPPQGLCRKHIGVYAWQRDALLQFPSMPPRRWNAAKAWSNCARSKPDGRFAYFLPPVNRSASTLQKIYTAPSSSGREGMPSDDAP